MPSLINEYISKRWGAIDFENELRRLVQSYNNEKDTYLFIYSVDMEKAGPPKNADVSLTMADYQMFYEMLRNVDSSRVDIYIETPGGSGEAAEEIVEFLHKKFENVDFIIAGEAKSAGTLMVMSADDIYMTESGSLGPIDAQVRIGRSVVSAFDYVDWMTKKRKEAEEKKGLNPVDAMMIAQITPGEFEGVYHAQEFAVDCLRKWLPQYKFKHWKETETRKLKVSEEMKAQKAAEIANKLIDHEKWRSHGRSLKISDLEELGLRIKKIDGKNNEIIHRIKTVIRLLFSTSTHYKMFVTSGEKLFRDILAQNVKQGVPLPTKVPLAEIGVTCPKCGKQHNVYAIFGKVPPELEADIKLRATKYPANNKLTCECGCQIDLLGLRNQLERQTGARIQN
ncbi:MAG: ATP-dependent Clp protease proteolytic subunit [Bacteroidales bacterium]|nr:ATP-dependent Clp protease proteolytic subunit [Bacteroidales bacterium]